MTIPPGEYVLGPDNAALLLHTRTDGVAAAMGHNLTIEATSWSASVAVGDTPAASSLSARAELTSLSVLAGEGGAKPLTEGDKVKILENAAKTLESAKHPTVEFVADAIEGDWTSAVVHGRLTLHGRTQALDLDLDSPDPGSVRLRGMLSQKAFGIKQFSTLMGTLKLHDEVTVEVTVPFA
ncbi:MAG: YceI family protein [Tetrasphaera sp.]|nr:YceI family protein [Tetrasphaera sp.]